MAVHQTNTGHSGYRPGGGTGSVVERLKQSFRALPRVLQGLIVLEAVLYLAALASGKTGQGLLAWVALVPATILDLELWRLATYWPFHAGNDPLGAIFDIVFLWSLGGIFARRWRPNHFLFFFVASCMGAGVVDWLLFLVVPSAFAGAQLGSSGGSYALFMAFYLVFGESHVSVMGSAPMKGKWLFVLLFGLQLLFFVTGVNPAFGVQAGGALMGWLLVTGRWRPAKFRSWLDSRRARRGARQRAEAKSRFRIIN
jgi:membrane associated rhomboid family serine protease